MASTEGMKFHFARFTAHEKIFMAFPGDFHGIFTCPCFIVNAPTYIHQLIRLKPQSNCNLRSNTKRLLLDLPNKTMKTTGDRAFFAATPTLWNALPDELRALGGLKTFIAQLKTHFKLAYSL